MPFNYEEYNNLNLEETQDQLRTTIIKFNSLEKSFTRLETDNNKKNDKIKSIETEAQARFDRELAITN
jgi:hypothetical protein